MKGPQRDRKHRRRSVLDGLGRRATRAGEGTGLPEPFTRTASPPPWSPVGAEGRTKTRMYGWSRRRGRTLLTVRGVLPGWFYLAL